MPDTAARYRVEDPFDPHANIEGGIRYLRDLLRLFPGDLRTCWRPTMPAKGLSNNTAGIPPYPETQRYVERVMALYSVALPRHREKSIAIVLLVAIYY